MADDIDTQTLRAFLAVAETGSFSRAATRVHRSQSAVSMQIKKLEARLEETVFRRDSHRVELTPQGERLVGYARRLIQLHDTALAEVRGTAVRGTVRIGVMDDYATHVLPQILAGFGRRHAGVTLEVTTGMTAELIAELGESYDLVLATQPMGTGEGRVLRTEDACWAFAARLPLPSLEVVPLAVLGEGNLFRTWATGALDKAGLAWRIVFRSTSISAMEAAAEAGIALTVVKRGTARPGLRLLGPGEGLPPLPVCEIALHRSPAATAPAVRSLARYLEAELGQPGAV